MYIFTYRHVYIYMYIILVSHVEKIWLDILIWYTVTHVCVQIHNSRTRIQPHAIGGLAKAGLAVLLVVLAYGTYWALHKWMRWTLMPWHGKNVVTVQVAGEKCRVNAVLVFFMGHALGINNQKLDQICLNQQNWKSWVNAVNAGVSIVNNRIWRTRMIFSFWGWLSEMEVFYDIFSNILEMRAQFIICVFVCAI